MKDIIKLSGDTLLNEMMWPATRYCIGRHTYVSSYAETYWRIIRNNRKAFSEERLQFFARDIKNNIADAIGWWKNINIQCAGNERIKYDPYFLLTRYFYEHPDTDFCATDFDIDCISGEVKVTNRERPLTNTEIMFAKIPDHDLKCWSMLASSISDAHTVKVKEIGDVEVIETYEQVRYSANEPWRWEKRLRTTGSWFKYVPQEHLIEADR